MKRLTMILFATLFLAIGWSICPIEGFIPNKFLALLAKTLSFSLKSCLTHQDMSRSAILEVATEVLRETPNPNDAQSAQRLSSLDLSSLDEKSILKAYYGSCDRRRNNIFRNAVEAMKKATAGVDAGEEKHLAAAHFDSEQFESGQDRLIALRQSVVSWIQKGNYDAARRDTGRMFHTLQDFYSHTSWIENGNQAPNPVLGQPDQRIENTANQTEVTCTDIGCVSKGLPGTGRYHYYECRDNIKRSLIDNGILTSGYGAVQTDYNGTVIEKRPGKCSHGGFFVDKKQDTPARGGINKDSPYKKVSPHYYLYDEAASQAIRATASILRDMRGDVNDDQKFGEYLGVFESRASAERSAGSHTMYSRNRNAMLQRHLNRITDLRANSQIEDEDAVVAEIVELMAKMEQIYKRQYRAEQQARAVAKRSAPQSNGESNENMPSIFSGAVSTFPLLPMELLVMTGSVLICYF